MLEIDARPALVAGDEGRMTQVVDNLLSNALRYTDPGGLVTVRTFADDEAALEVSDTGLGLAR